MRSGNREVGRTSHPFANCDSFSPKDRICSDRPLCLIAVDCLEQRLAHVVMSVFDQSICTRVITTNANVADVVLVGEIFQSGDEGGAIVSDNFRE